jgi:hypothetical protein
MTFGPLAMLITNMFGTPKGLEIAFVIGFGQMTTTE